MRKVLGTTIFCLPIIAMIFGLFVHDPEKALTAFALIGISITIMLIGAKIAKG